MVQAMAQGQIEGSHVLRAIELLSDLQGKKLEAVCLGPPKSIDHAAMLGRIIGKLSPLVSDLLEYEFAAHLNAASVCPPGTRWVKQDPGFPDLALDTGEARRAGIEIKTWFPLGTEVTGRFRESQTSLAASETLLMVVAWVPEFLLHGRPLTLRIWVDEAINVARVRDSKYHRPPQYIVIEPESASQRENTHHQSHAAGYFFRGSQAELADAKAEIESWGSSLDFSSAAYQANLWELTRKHPYVLDTNFAKFDRIEHKPLQDFKAEVLAMPLHGRTIGEWRDGIWAEAEDVLEEITHLNRHARVVETDLPGPAKR